MPVNSSVMLSRVVHVSESLQATLIGSYSPESKAVPKLYPLVFDERVNPRLRTDWSRHIEQGMNRKPYGEVKTYFLRKAFVFRTGFIVADGEGNLLGETVRKPKTLQYLLSGSERRISDDLALSIYHGDASCNQLIEISRQSSTSGYLVSPAVYDNYYHWLVECIPQLLLHGICSPETPLYVPRSKKFQCQSLQFFAPNSRLIKVDQDIRIDGLVLSQPMALNNVRHSPAIRDFFRPYQREAEACNKYYITRADAGTRRCINEERLVEILVKRGFAIVNLSKLGFTEAFNIFSTANVVVGAHGAGLANIVFMPPGGKVIELIPSTFNAGITSFYALCELFELNYFGLLCQAKEGNKNPCNNDFTCSKDILEWISSAV